MDYTITPAPSRSLVRRLASWTAALGLLAGGGYGVYHYAAPQFGVAPVENAVTADPGVNAETETPNARLLAAVPAGGTTRDFANPYATPSPVAADRYAAAPMLPPTSEDDEVTTPRSAAAVDAPANPFGADPMARYSGYSAPTPAVEPPPVEPTEPAAQETSVDAAVDGAAPPPVVSDIARGQEPDSVNPLRAASRSPATSRVDEAGEARAAFGRDSLPPQPTALSARPEGDAAKGTTGSPTAADTALAPLGSRYGAVAAGVEEPELADEDATAAPLTSAAAMPRVYDGASPPAYVNLTPVTPPAEPPATSTAPEQFGASFAAADPGITPTPGLATADGTGRPGERILEGLQSPALTIQKAAPPEIQVGKKCTFFIRVQNNSQRTVHNVVVSDEVPLGTQLVGTAPKANVSGALVQWELGTLSAGEERIVEMELLPTEEGELGSVATVTFATQASAKARCTRPQLALRLSSNPRVMIGEQQLVQIEVTNPGSGDATGVMLLESVPQGVSHEAGPALEFEVGTLRPGETRRMELMLQADEAGLIDNIMTARADANLQVQASCQFEVIAPDLKVTVDGPQKRYLERPATYTVSVDNPGTASAREVQLVTTLPPGLQFVSANNMGEYDAATHSVHWSLAELPANQRGTVEVTALPVESGDHTLQFATRAAQGLEDTTEAHVSVEGIVALTFEVQGDDGAIEVGGETAYEIRVVNQGSKAASNVQVVAVMPAGLRAQAGQGDSRYQAQGDRVVFAPLPQLAPKADATFRFRVQGLRPGDQRVTLQVTTDEVRDPIIEVESTQVYSDE